MCALDGGGDDGGGTGTGTDPGVSPDGATIGGGPVGLA